MSYRTGTAGLFEALSFVFIINISRVFLSGPAALYDRTAQFTWIAVLLGGLYSMVAAYALIYAFARVPGDLLTVSRQLIGRVGAWLISLYYFLIFWANGILQLRQLADSTVTTALPNMRFEVMMAFYTVFVAYLCFLSLGGIARAASLFLWYIVTLFLIIYILLLPYYNVYHLIPWQGHGIKKGLMVSAELSNVNIGVMALLVMAPSFQSLRTIKAAAFYGLASSVLLGAAHTVTYLMVFGIAVGVEKTLPFYEMARLVYISRYFQHIEALLILVWGVCGLMAIAGTMYVASYILARLLDLPTLRAFLPLMMLLTASLALLFESADSVMAAEAIYSQATLVGLYIIPAILFAVAFWKMRNKPCVRQ